MQPQAYTAHGRAPSSFPGTLASRAIARPIRFADDPPPARLPAKPSHPIASASQRTTVRSTVTAAGADRQAVTFWLSTDAYRSPIAATGSPEPST
jgi:hypothetical protein